jgi:putative endonuclease
MYLVYAIASIHRNYIYVGLTSDIEERLYRHNSGYEKTTKPYAPFDLIFTEESESRIEARKREKYWKSTTGKERLRQILKERRT